MDRPKVLGQAAPAAGALTSLYTVTAAIRSVVSTLKACNRSSSPTTIRVSIAIAGAADTPAQYVYYDLPLAANDTFSATEGWTLAPTDVVRVYSGNGNVAFNIFGVETT